MGGRTNYVTGELINGIEYLSEAPPDIAPTGRKHRRGWFKCPRCSNKFSQRYAAIKNSTVKSCGCYNKSGEAHIIHGLTGSRIMKIWTLMKQRCYNPNNTNYFRYGGKSISVCTEWKNSVETFATWANSNGYQESLTIDRINGDLNYCPQNCRWVTQTTQTRNRGINKNNKSGYKGVYLESRSNKYIAQITVNYRGIYLGRYECPKEAAEVYNTYVVKNNLEHLLNEI